MRDGIKIHHSVTMWVAATDTPMTPEGLNQIQRAIDDLAARVAKLERERR